jgi:hypothetical protein
LRKKCTQLTPWKEGTKETNAKKISRKELKMAKKGKFVKEEIGHLFSYITFVEVTTATFCLLQERSFLHVNYKSSNNKGHVVVKLPN